MAYQRQNVYEALPITIERLKEVSKVKELQLQKVLAELKKANIDDSRLEKSDETNNVLLKADGSNFKEFRAHITSILNAPASSVQKKNSKPLMKAEDTSSYKEFNQYQEAEQELVKSMHTQIDALQQDFAGGRVNYVRFLEFMQPVRNFLKENVDYNPVYFKRNAIETIINQHYN